MISQSIVKVFVKIQRLRIVSKCQKTPCQNVHKRVCQMPNETYKMMHFQISGSFSTYMLSLLTMNTSSVIIISDSICRDLPSPFPVLVYPGANIDRLQKKIKDLQLNFYDNIILHVGTNNIKPSSDPEDIVKKLINLQECIKLRNPQSKVFISAILPRPRDFQSTDRIVQQVNWMLRNRILYTFLPTQSICFQDGRLDFQLFTDGLHLTQRGKQRLWSQMANCLLL